MGDRDVRQAANSDAQMRIRIERAAGSSTSTAMDMSTLASLGITAC
jgi:hypothetical protein